MSIILKKRNPRQKPRMMKPLHTSRWIFFILSQLELATLLLSLFILLSFFEQVPENKIENQNVIVWSQANQSL